MDSRLCLYLLLTYGQGFKCVNGQVFCLLTNGQGFKCVNRQAFCLFAVLKFESVRCHSAFIVVLKLGSNCHSLDNGVKPVKMFFFLV